MRDTVKNFLSVDSRPLPKVTNACVPWSSEPQQQENCFYECKTRGHIFYRRSEPCIRVRGNKRSESRNTDHCARRAEEAQLLAGSFARLLPELRLGFLLWEPTGEGVAGCGVAGSGSRSLPSAESPPQASHFSRTNCSRKTVRLEL